MRGICPLPHPIFPKLEPLPAHWQTPLYMIIFPPQELKVEPRSPPQTSNEEIEFNVNVPTVPVNLPKTRVYARKPLPPPRQKEGTRKAFNIALKTLSSTLKRKK